MLSPLGILPIRGSLDSEGVTWCRLRWELQESAALLSRLTRHVTAYLNPKDCLDWFNKPKPTLFYIRLVVDEKDISRLSELEWWIKHLCSGVKLM